MYETIELPESAFKCRHPLEFYKLKQSSKPVLEDMPYPSNYKDSERIINYQKRQYKKALQDWTFIKENIELRIGMNYYIYSEKSQGFYLRKVEGQVDYMKHFFYEIMQGHLKLVYSPEDIQQIKEFMELKGIDTYTVYLRQIIGDYSKEELKGRKRYMEDWETKHKNYEQYSRG